LESFSSCGLCNLTASTPGRYLDDYKPATLRLKDFKALFREYRDLATEALETSTAIEAFGDTDIDYRIT